MLPESVNFSQIKATGIYGVYFESFQ